MADETEKKPIDISAIGNLVHDALADYCWGVHTQEYTIHADGYEPTTFRLDYVAGDVTRPRITLEDGRVFTVLVLEVPR